MVPLSDEDRVAHDLDDVEVVTDRDAPCYTLIQPGLDHLFTIDASERTVVRYASA